MLLGCFKVYMRIRVCMHVWACTCGYLNSDERVHYVLYGGVLQLLLWRPFVCLIDCCWHVSVLRGGLVLHWLRSVVIIYILSSVLYNFFGCVSTFQPDSGAARQLLSRAGSVADIR